MISSKRNADLLSVEVLAAMLPAGGSNVSPRSMSKSFQIGNWSFDPSHPALTGDGERRLQDRSARTLALLCERRGEIVTKEDLIASVWQGRSVSANSVAIVIGELRRALDDDPRDPIHIVTVAKRGYKLAPLPDDVTPPAPANQYGQRRRWLAGAAVLVIGVGALVLRPTPPVTNIAVEPTRNDTGKPGLDGLTRSLEPVVLDGVVRLPGVHARSGTSPGHQGGLDVLFHSRLILWNGSPELAMSATELQTGRILWSSFAAGPPALLARHVTDRIGMLPSHLTPGRGG